MKRTEVFDFLTALRANNAKEWMDANRNWYQEVKLMLEGVFNPILNDIKQVDPRIVQPNARKAFNRINNNLMFHPERPVYKDHFGIGFGYGKGLADFYIQVGPDKLLIAGGLWHPAVEKLKRLRSEIDYEGQRLEEIMKTEGFKKFNVFKEDRLKAAPRGYSMDHPYIYLLQMKSLAAWMDLKKEEFLSSGFQEKVLAAYLDILPFLDFINVAIAEDEFLPLD